MSTKTLALLFFTLALLIAGCGGTPESAVAVPTLAQLPTITPSNTPTATVESTDIPTETPEPTNTNTPTNTPTRTPTNTATPDIESTSYIATQNALATVNAANAATVAALDAAGLLPTATATQPPVLEREAATYFTQDGSVRVRSCQFISDECDDIVPELGASIAVTVTGTTNGDAFRGSTLWYRVTISGQTGFIHSALIAETPPEPTIIPADLTLTAVSATNLSTPTPVSGN